MPVNGKPNGRFELPQFTPLNFSLTDGTDIPPPPDSPVDEKPPPPAPLKLDIADNSTASHAAATNGNGAAATNGAVNGFYDGHGRSTVGGYSSIPRDNSKPPMSPTSSHTRPSSIRRFLSRKSLNMNYENGTNSNISEEDLKHMERPESSMSYASTTRPMMGRKKSGSWFRRISGSGGNRTSVIYEEKRASIVPMGPPPPKLPELSKLKAKIPEDDEGSLGGGDIFKNIK